MQAFRRDDLLAVMREQTDLHIMGGATAVLRPHQETYAIDATELGDRGGKLSIGP